MITLIAEEVATLVEVTTIRIVEAEEGDMEETAAEEVMEVVVTEEGPVEVKGMATTATISVVIALAQTTEATTQTLAP